MVSIPLPRAGSARNGNARALRRLYTELQKNARAVTRRRGAVLFRQGRPSRGVYLLTRGAARLWMTSPEGAELSSHAIAAPCMLGLPATMHGQPYNFSAQLTEDSGVARLEREDILSVLRRHHHLAVYVVEMLSQGVQEMVRHGGHRAHHALVKTRNAKQADFRAPHPERE